MMVLTLVVGFGAAAMPSCVRFHSSDKLDTVGKTYLQPVPHKEGVREIYRVDDRYFVRARVVKSEKSYPAFWSLACYGAPEVHPVFSPLPEQGGVEYVYAPVRGKAAAWLLGHVKEREFADDGIDEAGWMLEKDFDSGKAVLCRTEHPVTADCLDGSMREESSPAGVLLKPLVYLDFVAVDVPLSIAGTAGFWLSRPFAAVLGD